MSTPKWQAGTLYPTGSLVQPLTGSTATSTAITNPGFESGSADWTLGSGMSVSSSNPFSGANALQCTGTGGVSEVVHDESPVNPGQSITATAMYQQGGASSGQNVGRVFLRWYNSSMVPITPDTDGSQITNGSGNSYKQSTVTGIAPAGSAYVSIGGKVNRTRAEPSRFDNFAWNYAQAVAPAGLIYKAVQPTIGTSAATEPVWPLSVGLQVVDNTVIWEALIATRITYEAEPILLSGLTEPTWPEAIGEFVSDNTISWEAVPLQVVQAPQSKVVTIASSKVYAADGDIVRYCATVNPLDWNSEFDAGYLPTGLNQYGSNRTAVLNTYRGNVVPFSASTFLCYQADPDPANITQLDAMEGVGSTYQQAAHPVANDLFYLSPLGVRTVGIAVGTSNLSAGDAGAPIDPLVQAALVPAGIRPMAAYYPNQGQYWLAMRPPLPELIGPSIEGSAPDGVVGVTYAGATYIATPGDAPIEQIYVSGPEFPPGLNMDNDGVVDAGPPTKAGIYTYPVTAVDDNGLEASLTDTVVITCAPGSIGTSITNTLTIPDSYRSSYIYPLANGNLGVAYAVQQVFVGGFYHTREYNSSLTQVGSTVDIEWMAGSVGTASLFLRGVNEDGLGISADDNSGYCKLIDTGVYQGYYQPDYAPTADYFSWWYAETNWAPEYGGLVWFGPDADNVECVYIGVRKTGVLDSNPPPRVFIENVILKFPLTGGAATAQLEVAQSVGTATNPRFWMTRARDKMIYAITQDGNLLTYDSDLALQSTVALTFPVTGTGNILRGFGVDGDVLALVYEDGGTTGQGRIEFRNLFTQTFISSISSANVVGREATRVLFTNNSCYVQCRNWVGRIPFSPPVCEI